MAVRILREYVQKSLFGRWNLSPHMISFCYCSTLKGPGCYQDTPALWWAFRKREWIEQAKETSLCKRRTITRDFWVNDILWQLSQLAYNISIMIRYVTGFWRKLYARSIQRFAVGLYVSRASVVESARRITVKMPKKYLLETEMERDFEQQRGCKIAV